MIQPPLWPGKVSIHIIPEDQRNKHKTIDVRILQAAVDLGLIDSSDVEIGPPSEVTIGYPSGDSK